MKKSTIVFFSIFSLGLFGQEVRNGNHIAFERKMPMSLSGVESMFRLVNLRDLSAPGGSLPSEPANLPDEVTEETNVFFLHVMRQ